MVRRCAGTQQQDLRHPVRIAVRVGDLAREPHCNLLCQSRHGLGQVVGWRACAQRQDLWYPLPIHEHFGDRCELADDHHLWPRGDPHLWPRGDPRRWTPRGQVEWWRACSQRCACKPSSHEAPQSFFTDSLPPSRAGKIYGIPWRSSSILEFDPETMALRLFGQQLTATNYTLRVEAVD